MRSPERSCRQRPGIRHGVVNQGGAIFPEGDVGIYGAAGGLVHEKVQIRAVFLIMGVQKIRAGGGAHHVRTGRQRLGQVLRGNHLRAGQGDGAAEIGPLAFRGSARVKQTFSPACRKARNFSTKAPGSSCA